MNQNPSTYEKTVQQLSREVDYWRQRCERA